MQSLHRAYLRDACSYQVSKLLVGIKTQLQCPSKHSCNVHFGGVTRTADLGIVTHHSTPMDNNILMKRKASQATPLSSTHPLAFCLIEGRCLLLGS